MCSECHGQVVTRSLRWRPKPEYVGTVLNIKVDSDKTMKRRSDFILEKLNLNSKNQKNDISNNNDSLMEAPTNTDEKSAGGHISTIFSVEKKLDKENIPEKVKSFTQSPSIIEDSLDGSVPYFDPKTFLMQDANEVETINNIQDFTQNEDATMSEVLISGETEIKQSTKPRYSSTSSSSSSSSSSRSSSTSSSSSSSRKSNSNEHSAIDGPSTSKLTNQVSSGTSKTYHQSPINSNESDADLSDLDPTYTVNGSSATFREIIQLSSSSTSSSRSSSTVNSAPETAKRSRKRTRDPSKWKQNIAKALRNSGKAYVSSSTKKEVPARCVKDACKCRLKCVDNISDTDRNTLFETYWSIGDIEIQRSYIRSCMVEVKPKYRYTNADKPRLPNNAFYFTVNNVKIRVCKTFFINTLGICDRQIRTVKKKTDPQGFVISDNRGKSSSRKPVNPILIESIKQHINSIPRIESHYLRASTSREYI
ncbi:hypothetical protein MSG28_007808 [Choristoneura fumiferana]|uniref:Uncharacterized protein n=1 Tax=Choristoneura fumiferana TaxID=7141 RepID=A0ACC0JYY2_CHOFU|nr:hypothetical protein MSG28_007808 [Choristoneura fumiferana]